MRQGIRFTLQILMVLCVLLAAAQIGALAQGQSGLLQALCVVAGCGVLGVECARTEKKLRRRHVRLRVAHAPITADRVA